MLSIFSGLPPTQRTPQPFPHNPFRDVSLLSFDHSSISMLQNSPFRLTEFKVPLMRGYLLGRWVKEPLKRFMANFGVKNMAPSQVNSGVSCRLGTTSWIGSGLKWWYFLSEFGEFSSKSNETLNVCPSLGNPGRDSESFRSSMKERSTKINAAVTRVLQRAKLARMALQSSEPIANCKSFSFYIRLVSSINFPENVHSHFLSCFFQCEKSKNTHISKFLPQKLQRFGVLNPWLISVISVIRYMKLGFRGTIVHWLLIHLT